MVLLALAISAGLFLLPLGLVVIPVAFLLWLAFTLVRITLRLAVGVVLLPLLFASLVVGALVAGIGLALAVLVPLVPVALVALGIWIVLKLVSRPARQPAA